MKKPFMQVASDGIYEVIVEGVISSEMWWGDEFTPDMVREELAKANGNPIRIIINSPGGEVFAGAAIYNALLHYPGRKTVRVDGVAASMASVIAMVGDEIIMSPGSTMMIHRPLVGAYGNVKDLENAIEMLKAIEDTIIPIYAKRTGLSNEEIFALLEEEKWLSPQEAQELGFADKVEEETQTASAFEKIKAILADQKFAFSMSAIHKSLGDYVAKAESTSVEASTDKKEVQDDTTATAPTDEAVEQPNEAETSAESGKPEETGVEETPKAPEVTEPEASETKKTKEKTMNQAIAADTVVEPTALADPAAATAKKEGLTTREAKRMVAEAFAAAYRKDKAEFDRLTSELSAKMIIDGGNTELFGSQIFDRDIREAYLKVGRVGQLVNRIDIEGAGSLKVLIEQAVTAFAPTALGKEKDVDQPIWVPVTWAPHEWSKIVPWLDGVQRRSPLAIYNIIVRYIARSLALTEDTIILTYAGGTVDGEVFPATGLVPILTSAGRVTPVNSYDSADVIPALGEAYGAIESDLELTLVANRKTWGRLATSLDNEGRPIFTVVGQKVQAGALGTFNVVESQVLNDGDVVFGAFGDYTLATRGNVDYLFSREATIGDPSTTGINLFTQNGSAVRASIEYDGRPERNTSFQLLQFATS